MKTTSILGLILLCSCSITHETTNEDVIAQLNAERSKFGIRAVPTVSEFEAHGDAIRKLLQEAGDHAGAVGTDQQTWIDGMGLGVALLGIGSPLAVRYYRPENTKDAITTLSAGTSTIVAVVGGYLATRASKNSKFSEACDKAIADYDQAELAERAEADAGTQLQKASAMYVAIRREAEDRKKDKLEDIVIPGW
jgi:hypothetical protein